MLSHTHMRGVSKPGAPFVFLILLLSCLLLLSPAGSQALSNRCAPQRINEQVKVSYVYDGDTVKLSDGRRVRLIGINTPETGHHNRRPEPYAEIARTSLIEMLESADNNLSLQYGQERKDHYGRVLAHVYLENGEDVALRLLQQGLATTLVVPPNTWAAGCYQQAEQTARNAGRGLWQLDSYQIQAVDALPPDTRGFRIVRGQVDSVARTRNQVRILLQGKLAARIANADLDNFKQGYLEKLTGRTVELRGWIKPERKILGIRIRHPAALFPVSDTD